MDSSIRISRHGNHIDTLIKKGMELRCAVDSLKAQLDDINRQIADMAVFADGRNTAWVCGTEYKARVVNRVYEKWDQALLNEARSAMGEETFALLFKQVWEPVSRRDVQGFLTHGPAELAARLREARSEKVTASVSFVTQDEKVESRNSGIHGAPAELRTSAEPHAHAEFRESPAPAGARDPREIREPSTAIPPRIPSTSGTHAAEGSNFPRDHRDFRRKRGARLCGSATETPSPTPFGLPHFLSRAFGSSASA